MTRIGIGVIGMGWMSGVHSRAYRQIPDRFHGRGIEPRLIVCADAERDRADAAREQFGFERAATDWRAVVDARDVEVFEFLRSVASGTQGDPGFAAAGAVARAQRALVASWDSERWERVASPIS